MLSITLPSSPFHSTVTRKNQHDKLICTQQSSRLAPPRATGFGRSGDNNKNSNNGSNTYKLQDEIRAQRTAAITSTDLLAKLLSAQAQDNAKEIAQEYVDSINEEFMQISSGYLAMAKKEGNDDVTKQLEQVLKTAMEVKNSTLRLEIQLLNKLLQCETELQMKQTLNSASSGDVLQMNDFYFFGLLQRMQNDVNRSPDGVQKDDLGKKLQSIREAALNRLPTSELKQAAAVNKS